jgi:sec-independent protein translocase protein TatB
LAVQVSLPFMVIPPPIDVASLGMADSLILMVLALVVFGPRRLPQIGRQIGKLMYEFRKASNDFKYQMEEELRNAEDADRKKKEEERLSTLALPAPAEATETPGPATGFTADSPYPGDDQYPAAIEDGTQPEESYPSIHPPTNGEQVPAAPPSGLATQAEPSAADETVPVTEQAAHHG